MTDLIILGMLLSGPQHGYRLKQNAGMIFGQGELHNNLVYPLLRRFVANRWVTRKTVPGARGQNRQQYAITSVGRQALVDRLTAFSEKEAKSEDAFRVRVGFFGMLGEKDRDQILDLREGSLRSRNQNLGNLQKALGLDLYANEVVAFLREQTSVELEWIGRLRKLDSKAQRTEAN